MPILAVLGSLVILYLIFAGMYTDLLWYRSLERSSVFLTQLSSRLGMFAVFGLVLGLAIGVNMTIAYRSRPRELMLTPGQASLQRYRDALRPIRRAVFVVVPALFGALAGVSASSNWSAYQLWANRQTFGYKDPQFGLDAGFYVFSFPFIRFVLGFLMTALVLATIAAVVIHYLYGGLRLQPAGDRMSDAAEVHFSILLGLFCVLKAASYWMDRYGLVIKSEGLVQGFTGLKYRDAFATIPAKNILFVIALFCAVLFFFNAVRRTWQLPVIALGLLGLSAFIIGGVYPAIVQQFQVRPSELVKEQEFIKRNIDATRLAYGINGIQTTEYAAKTVANDKVLKGQTGTLDAIRLMDPALLSPTFKALQVIRGYYTFPEALDIDRYDLKGKSRGSVVAVREVNLDGVSAGQRNWANEHVVYTHGYGMVAAYDNVATSDGKPSFFEQDIPPRGELDITQPRVYFGENSPPYSIVGAPAGAPPRELDKPDDAAPNGQVNNTYDGSGGVPVGSFARRMLFATKYQDPNILLSDLINSESKILWDRDPRDRVSKVVPWITPDGDPYPVAVDGRIKWIVDGYTASNTFPNSTRVTLSDATSDTLTERAANVVTAPRDQVNYLRNSVKAVVDAYDGTVEVYGWDESDPVLKAWTQTFPGVVKPKSEIPESILKHVRYPEDIFKVQRLMYSRYHVTDPAAFYGGQDFWIVPNDPTNRDAVAFQPPYYLQMQMPDQPAPRFQLTTTFAPSRRQTLAAFMAVDSDPGEQYGIIRVLQLPRNTAIPGPTQVQNTFESDPKVATELSLLRRSGSDVELGNLLSLPVADGFLYVEPVYVRAVNDGFPLFRRVLVSFGDKVAFEDTLSKALAQVFGESAGSKPSGGGGGGSATAEQDLSRALDEANRAYEQGQQALKTGDFATYGEAQKKLERAIRDAQDAANRIQPAGDGKSNKS